MIDPVDHVTQPLPIDGTGPICLRFETDARRYTVVLMQDLFADWIVVQRWEGKFTRRGGGMTKLVESFEAGIAYVEAIRKKRTARGYRPVSSDCF